MVAGNARRTSKSNFGSNFIMFSDYCRLRPGVIFPSAPLPMLRKWRLLLIRVYNAEVTSHLEQLLAVYLLCHLLCHLCHLFRRLCRLWPLTLPVTMVMFGLHPAFFFTSENIDEYLEKVFKNAYIPSNKLLGRTRKAGEPLLELAQAIEGLTRRAFVHMSSSVQEELSRDQFVEALGPGQLWSQVRLLHPQSLQEVLEMAHERGV
ncbi:UNVERIFIED_CONTAM: hypothetical protein FKN15_028290 [Acipenser sinensis]